MLRAPMVRLIAGREIRDLLRDRRTVTLILVMPLVLYPFFGLAGYAFARIALEQTTVVGVAGREFLPASPALLDADTLVEGGRGEEPADAPGGMGDVRVTPLTGDPAAALKAKAVDAVLIVPAGFAADLLARRLPTLRIEHRDGDEKSKLASRRLTAAVRKWEAQLREQRFQNAGLPKDFDRVFKLEDPTSAKPKLKRTADELRDTFVRTFPFILMMWLVAGAIQPAVDVTAGEKERGTMETLLISPAQRGEIVFGKFLAVTIFAFASVVWNVVWLSVAAAIMSAILGFPVISVPGVLGCVLMALPLAMLFSALCLALGVFAKSTKEGQYYLIPLMLGTMPLAMLSLLPGLELNAANALVPVTGAMLMQQKLLAVSGDPVPWVLFLPVLGSLGLCVTVALWFAVRQFNRESVLFRESGSEKGGPLGSLFNG